MLTKKYLIKKGTKKYYITLFNNSINTLFKIKLNDGNSIKGSPIKIDKKVITFKSDTSKFYEIPITLIKSAQEIAILNDRYYMSLAIKISRKCVPEKRAKPTPSVGAVLVKDNCILAKGYRGQKKTGQHAEYFVLEKLLKNRNISGSDLYTTLEPCTIRNNPKIPCVERIKERKISRVVIGILDPNQEIRGEGVWILREAGIAVVLCDPDQMAEIEEINRTFIRYYRKLSKISKI